MVFLFGYVATGVVLLTAGTWHYQVSVKNIFVDFTLASSLAITMLLTGLIVACWPGFALGWMQVRQPQL